MIVKKYILKTLKDLDRLYNSSSSTFEATYYSKLAIIEACGWIELTMDYIAEAYIKRKIISNQYQDIFNSIKGKNYGFHYKHNFRKMLLPTIGIKQMEIIERKLNRRGAVIDILHSQLEILKDDRNNASHTYINATTTYPAPSLTKSRVETIYPILKKIHSEIKNI